MSQDRIYIVSTMTNSVNYGFYDYVGKDKLPMVKKKILIHGGAGMPSLRSGFGIQSKDLEERPMWTAAGMATSISAEDYAMLKDHPVFIKHKEKGFVKVWDRDITGNHKEVVKITADMERDGFQQLTPATLKQRIKVKVGLPQDGTEDGRL